MKLARLPIAAMALGPCVVGAQETIAGRVFDAYTQAPLSEVVVATDGQSPALSDADGTFAFSCRSGVVLTLRRLGYETQQSTITDCGEPARIGLVPSAQNLNSVSVVAAREGPALRQPLSVGTLSRAELTRGTGLFLDEAINLMPGVRMERRTMSGGQRITIRGYGNGTNFDGTGYKAYLNGVPITDAEGVTVLDDVDFATLGRVEVIRGPGSPLYGAGIGGTVNLFTTRPDARGTSVEQSITAGADGLFRSDTRLASVGNSSTMLLNYGHQGYDSYRIHSASRKDHAVFIGDFRPSDRRSLSTFLSYGHSFDERAGQLDSAQFFGEQNAGETRYLDNDAHVDMESLRAGLTHHYRLSDAIGTSVTGYYTGTTREDIFAVGVNPRSAQTFGARALVRASFGSTARPVTGTTGAEFEKTNAFAKGYSLNNKVMGGITTDLETAASTASLFTQWDVGLPAQFTATVGGSLNFLEYALTDRLTNTANPTHADLSGRKVFSPVFTPRLALTRMFGDNVSAYASVSQGYTPPTSRDAVIPATGEANTGLKPERGTLFEVGSKGIVLGDRLSYQVALFDLRVSDKLTTQGVFDGSGTQLYSFRTNAGDQSNRGVELAASYALLNAPGSLVTLLRPFVSFAYSDFSFTDFRSDNNNNASTIDYTGKRVPGVPTTAFSMGVDAASRIGAYLYASLDHTGDMPITNDNSHSAPAYTLLNAKVGYRTRAPNGMGVDAFIGGTNLTNERYYTMVFLNANFSGPSPAIYLPGPYSARLYGGVRLGYLR